MCRNCSSLQKTTAIQNTTTVITPSVIPYIRTFSNCISWISAFKLLCPFGQPEHQCLAIAIISMRVSGHWVGSSSACLASCCDVAGSCCDLHGAQDLQVWHHNLRAFAGDGVPGVKSLVPKAQASEMQESAQHWHYMGRAFHCASHQKKSFDDFTFMIRKYDTDVQKLLWIKETCSPVFCLLSSAVFPNALRSPGDPSAGQIGKKTQWVLLPNSRLLLFSLKM